MRGLKFRDACGHNPDAIWDNIVCNFRCSSVIYIKGIYKMIKYYETDVKLFINILNKIKEWYKKFNEYIYIIFLD